VAFERNRAREHQVLVHQLIDWDQRLIGTNLEKMLEEENVAFRIKSTIDTRVRCIQSIEDNAYFDPSSNPSELSH
jgi:hypothetical protein